MLIDWMLQRRLASNIYTDDGMHGQRTDDDDGTDDGTDGQRTDDDDGRTWTDGQRTDDDDGRRRRTRQQKRDCEDIVPGETRSFWVVCPLDRHVFINCKVITI